MYVAYSRGACHNGTEHSRAEGSSKGALLFGVTGVSDLTQILFIHVCLGSAAAYSVR